jgi:hypothetical protein
MSTVTARPFYGSLANETRAIQTCSRFHVERTKLRFLTLTKTSLAMTSCGGQIPTSSNQALPATLRRDTTTKGCASSRWRYYRSPSIQLSPEKSIRSRILVNYCRRKSSIAHGAHLPFEFQFA